MKGGDGLLEVYAIVGAFILLDILTGVLKAVRNKKLSSTILRHGLYHKVTELILLLSMHLFQFACQYVEVNAHVPTLKVTAGYICLMELLSVIENLCEMNETLQRIFSPFLNKLKDIDVSGGEN